MHYDVHSRPQCVDGASAARRPRVGRMLLIWRVIAAITPMRRRMRYGSETLEIPGNPTTI